MHATPRSGVRSSDPSPRARSSSRSFPSCQLNPQVDEWQKKPNILSSILSPSISPVFRTPSIRSSAQGLAQSSDALSSSIPHSTLQSSLQPGPHFTLQLIFPVGLLILLPRDFPGGHFSIRAYSGVSASLRVFTKSPVTRVLSLRGQSALLAHHPAAAQPGPLTRSEGRAGEGAPHPLRAPLRLLGPQDAMAVAASDGRAHACVEVLTSGDFGPPGLSSLRRPAAGKGDRLKEEGDPACARSPGYFW